MHNFYSVAKTACYWQSVFALVSYISVNNTRVVDKLPPLYHSTVALRCASQLPNYIISPITNSQHKDMMIPNDDR